MDELRDIERPIHVFGVCDKVETFHSGHDTKEEAEARKDEANKEAIALGIKTRYVVKEK